MWVQAIRVSYEHWVFGMNAKGIYSQGQECRFGVSIIPRFPLVMREPGEKREEPAIPKNNNLHNHRGQI